MNKVNLTIDGKPVAVPEGSTILKAAASLGIELPTLCHHEKLPPFASCWLCAVAVKGFPRHLAACSTVVSEGLEVETDTPAVRAARRLCLELLLSDHCGDCLSPCQVACPAGVEVEEYARLIGEGRPEAAYEVIRRRLPFPAVIGRICPHPCEAECRRERVEAPLAICALKRFAADAVLSRGPLPLPEKRPATGKKAAVIGAGPAGLSCAYYLLAAGHQVEIFDARAEPGGMLRYGIPAYRLPRPVLADEVDTVRRLGAVFHFGTRLGADLTLDQLAAKGFGAVFLAIGAWTSAPLKIPGEDAPGITGGIDFLAAVAAGDPPAVGRRVVVIGGGNTAVDAARTARRLGAEQVTILYRRTRQEMPASAEEVEAAAAEGIELKFLAAPTAAAANGPGISLTCLRMELGAPDASGRRRPVPVAGSEFTVAADLVVAAIGQQVAAGDLGGPELPLTRWGTLDPEPRTLRLGETNLFAGGDCVSGPATAVAAIGSGRRAAAAMDQLLRGEAVTGEPTEFNTRIGSLEAVPDSLFAGIDPAQRQAAPQRPAAERLNDFAEVEGTLDPAAARAEAARCLACGCQAAADCRLRRYAAEYGADPQRFAGERRQPERDLSHPRVALDAGKCILCGICVRLAIQDGDRSSLGFVGRGFAATVRPPFHQTLADVCGGGHCRLLAGVCPTGALVDKTPPAAIK